MLYIPESFRADHKDEIAQRRMAKMMPIVSVEGKVRRLMLMIAEVKEFAPSKYGHKLIVKHVPDFHFMISDDLYRRLVKRFELEIGLANATPGSHLIAIATFGIGSTGVASIEEISLMCVNDNWIPFETMYDQMLLTTLVDQSRHFVKSMRYNLPSTSPLACAVLTDIGKSLVAAYIMQPGASNDYLTAVDALISGSDLQAWKWEPGNGAPIPTLPFPGLSNENDDE
ncbi:hypothetical protein BGZ97_009660 [Linnemannia gamsii]|uniref:Uncharacterized protein n=1 Tax=Linnemannia gamsii TaxID=64522 RepID=A0A9P6RB35_9FUNG|nr:hypothetical protein BGZ97_009660 [Linnemannia gamsii]